MANHTITSETITVHGRGSLVLPFKIRAQNGDQIDISAMPLYFEVDGVSIREPLETDPDDALGLRIVLERTQIQLLGTTPLEFVVVDETDAANDIYEVLWAGTITRKGYKGNPDAVLG